MTIETISTDVYPWAAPTSEQRAWFDGLPPEEKRKMIIEAIEEGFKSPLSSKSIDDIVREASADITNASSDKAPGGTRPQGHLSLHLRYVRPKPG